MRRLFRLLRNLALLFAVVVVALIVVLLVNVVRHPSQQLQVAPLAPSQVEQQAAAERLAQGIRFQTISSYDNPDQAADALRSLHAHLVSSFPAFHAAATREIIGGYSLLYTWPGSDPAAEPIALLAHQDVVAVAPGTAGDWTHPPFAGVVADGFIWGRGAWDCKGHLYGILEAAELMARQGFKPRRTIYFAFGHDEEVSGPRGAKAMAALFATRKVRLQFALDEGLFITQGLLKGLDRPLATVGVAEKGYATLELSTHATPGHSSMPPHDSAIGLMSAALARLDSNQLPMRLTPTMAQMLATVAPEMSSFANRLVLSNLWLFEPLLLRELRKSPPTEATVRSSTALTIVKAGDKDNVLPGNADATVNFRLLPGDTGATVVDHTRRVINDPRIAIKPFPGNTDPPPVTSTDTASWRALNATIREVFPDAVVAPALMVAASDSRHYAGVTDNLFRFSPIRAQPEDLKLIHGTNERISVAGYGDMIRFYRRFMEQTAR